MMAAAAAEYELHGHAVTRKAVNRDRKRGRKTLDDRKKGTRSQETLNGSNLMAPHSLLGYSCLCRDNESECFSREIRL